MNRKIAAAVLGVGVVAVAVVWLLRRNHDDGELVSYGNVDLRQVELPFADSERIAEVLVEEGDRVHAGQVLARLDTGRLLPRVQQAQAKVSAQQEALLRLRNGSRPEEVAQAKAALASAQADAVNARSQYERMKAISDESQGRAVSVHDVDASQAATQVADARVESSRKNLALVTIGPRAEDIRQAEAQLAASEAQLALLKRQLQDAELVSPVEAVVRSRLMEPGELATPQRPVFSLAVSSPKWIRTYVAEAALGKIALGMPAKVTTDSHPDTPIQGSVGFISSMAEFTPKTVQTEELRTSLVYEVRVRVDDPQDQLRLGMPATVHFEFTSPPGAETKVGQAQ